MKKIGFLRIWIDPIGEKRPNCMTARELRIAQRIVLELYCQYEQSLPFREVVSPEVISNFSLKINLQKYIPNYINDEKFNYIQ